MGMGYASSCLQDEWAIFNNPGGLSNIQSPVSAASYHAFPSFSSFNRAAATFALPFKHGAVSTGALRFGNKLYNEQIISAGAANKFGLASLGIKVNYLQYTAEGLGTKGLFSVSFGGIAELTQKISVSAYVNNLNTPRISEDQSVAATFIAGVGIKASEKTFIASDIEKQLNHPIVSRTGVEYRFSKKCCFRTGFNFNPNAAYIGFGFRTRKMKLDYASSYNSLGLSHQATVAINFSKR